MRDAHQAVKIVHLFLLQLGTETCISLYVYLIVILLKETNILYNRKKSLALIEKHQSVMNFKKLWSLSFKILQFIKAKRDYNYFRYQ